MNAYQSDRLLYFLRWKRHTVDPAAAEWVNLNRKNFFLTSQKIGVVEVFVITRFVRSVRWPTPCFLFQSLASFSSISLPFPAFAFQKVLALKAFIF